MPKLRRVLGQSSARRIFQLRLYTEVQDKGCYG